MNEPTERFIVTRDSIRKKERRDTAARSELAIFFAGLAIAAGGVHLIVNDIERVTEERERHPIENVDTPPAGELNNDIE